MSHTGIEAAGAKHRWVKLRLNPIMTANWPQPNLATSGRARMRQRPTNSTGTYLIGRTSVDAPTVPSNNLHEKALGHGSDSGLSLLIRPNRAALGVGGSRADNLRPNVALLQQ